MQSALADSAPARQGPLLTISLNTDIRGTNPGVTRDGNTDIVMHHIVEALVGYGEDLSIKPVVAEGFEISKDRRTYTFKLRAGLTFHNGAPVTSREVKWSWERYLNPATHWQCRNWFVDEAGGGEEPDGESSPIGSIDTPDARTVVFHLKRPSLLFLDYLANVQCVSAILHPESVAADGSWKRPVATGPYKLAQWKTGEYVELARFDGYQPRAGKRDGYAGRKDAYASRLRFVVSPDAAATKAALLSGGVDIYPLVPMSAVPELQAFAKVRLIHTSVLNWSVLLLQTRDPLLKDVRLRRAVAHAIDRKQIVGFNTRGFASVNSSAVPVGDANHTPVHDEWPAFDLAKARALALQSGCRGQPLKIQTNHKYPNMYDNAVIIQAMLQAAGINAQLEVLDWATQLSNYYSGKFQLSAFSYSALANPLMRYTKLIGSKDDSPIHQWESPRAMQLLQQAVMAEEPRVRRQLFEQLHRQMAQDVPIVGLYNPHNVTALRGEVRGYATWPLNTARLWGVWKADW